MLSSRGFGLVRAARRAAPSTARTVARRGMAGGGHAPKPTTGVEGFVRRFLPEDEHMALGIMGFYLSLYMLFKLGSGGKKEAAAPAPAPAAPAGEGMPSVETAEFSDWIAQEGNAEKFFAGLEKAT